MKLSRTGALLAFLLTASLANTQSFTRLAFPPDGQTAAAGLHFSLEGPDKPTAPDLWEGPLTITRGGTHCTVDASLIRSAYLSVTGKLLVVVSISGSNTFIHFYDPATCAGRWDTIKAFTQDVSIDGVHLQLAPACACEEPGKPCSCAAGQVYRLSDSTPPLYLPAGSRALTKRVLGVGFTGTRQLAPSSAAVAH